MKSIENLSIEKMAFGGYGLGYHAGKAIFVPYTMIGDVADVWISHSKKDHAFVHAFWEQLSEHVGSVSMRLSCFLVNHSQSN